MSKQRYRAAIIGLGYIGAADQVSGDALGQLVKDLVVAHSSGQNDGKVFNANMRWSTDAKICGFSSASLHRCAFWQKRTFSSSC